MKSPFPFRLFRVPAVAGAMLLGAVAALAQDAAQSGTDFDAALEQYLGPVSAQAQFGRSKSMVEMLRIDPIGLVTRAEGIGEQTVPLQGLRGFFAVGVTERPDGLYAEVKSGDREAGLARMREAYYPLIPFAGLPEENTNLHSFLGVGVDVLLKAGAIDEAAWLLDKLPEGVKSGKLRSITDATVTALIDAERFVRASAIYLQLPFDPANVSDLRNRIEIAHRLRGAGRPDDARVFYSQIADSATPLSDEAGLWNLYLGLSGTDIGAVEARFERVSLPERGSEIFQIYRLIEGRIELARDDNDGALVALADAIVNGPTTGGPRAEILYYTREAYRKRGSDGAADAIAKELNVLYPRSQWTAKL